MREPMTYDLNWQSLLEAIEYQILIQKVKGACNLTKPDVTNSSKILHNNME